MIVQHPYDTSKIVRISCGHRMNIPRRPHDSWEFLQGYIYLSTSDVLLTSTVTCRKTSLMLYEPPLSHTAAHGGPRVRGIRALFLNHSIISPLCLGWIRAPHWRDVRQAKFCLRVCQVVFLGVLPFAPIY